MANRFLLISPFPKDETVNSLLDRSASYSLGSTLHAECVRLLRRNKPLLDTVPCSLKRVCEVFGYAYGDVKAVLHEHTLFDFYACGVPPERNDVLQNRLIEDSHGPIRPTRLPLLFASAEQECLRCVDCDEHNLSKHGFIFIYRQHLAPFAQVCPWHGTLLAPDTKKLRLYDSLCRRSRSGNLALIHEYAVRASQCVGTSWHLSDYYRDQVIQCLVAKRWLSESMRWQTAAFLETFHKKFDKAFCDERLRCLCSTDRYVEAALRALMRSDRNVHPVWCVLFRWLADETENRHRGTRPAAQRQHHEPNLDSEELLKVLRRSSSLRAASKTLGISIHTLISIAKRHGLPVGSRPKRIYGADKQRIQQCLEDGLPAAQVAADCAVSLSTVYRLAAANPQCRTIQRAKGSARRLESARETWLAAVESNPTATVTELRRQHLGAWSYLYRHDSTWLEHHSPRRKPSKKQVKKAPPTTLLGIAANALEDASQKCATEESAPIRGSLYRLQALTGLSEYALSQFMAHRLPSLGDVVPETHQSFVRRRLQWAAQNSADAAHMPAWRLAKKAGLRLSSATSVLDDESFSQEVAGDSEARWHQFHPQKDFSLQNRAF